MDDKGFDLMAKAKKTPKDKCINALRGMGPSTGFVEVFESLNVAQKRFWYHYLMGECTNRTAAGKFAGWETPDVAAHLAIYSEKGRKLMGLYLSEFGITADSLMAELHRINHADMADFDDLARGKDTLADLRDRGVDTRQIKKFRITTREYTGSHPHTDTSTIVELYDRSKAIETMAKIRKLYDDDNTKSKVTVEVIVNRLNEEDAQITTRPEDVEAALNGGDDDSNS